MQRNPDVLPVELAIEIKQGPAGFNPVMAVSGRSWTQYVRFTVLKLDGSRSWTGPALTVTWTGVEQPQAGGAPQRIMREYEHSPRDRGIVYSVNGVARLRRADGAEWADGDYRVEASYDSRPNSAGLWRGVTAPARTRVLRVRKATTPLQRMRSANPTLPA